MLVLHDDPPIEALSKAISDASGVPEVKLAGALYPWAPKRAEALLSAALRSEDSEVRRQALLCYGDLMMSNAGVWALLPCLHDTRWTDQFCQLVTDPDPFEITTS